MVTFLNHTQPYGKGWNMAPNFYLKNHIPFKYMGKFLN